jgi:hypothetical protein
LTSAQLYRLAVRRRREELPTALQLKRLVGMGQALAASHLDVSRAAQPDEVGFVLRRGSRVLLQGQLQSGTDSVQVH